MCMFVYTYAYVHRHTNIYTHTEYNGANTAVLAYTVSHDSSSNCVF